MENIKEMLEFYEFKLKRGKELLSSHSDQNSRYSFEQGKIKAIEETIRDLKSIIEKK